jgi:CcmD family protein
MVTPDTHIYMVAGYAVIFTLLAVYIFSLAARWKSIRRKYQANRRQGSGDDQPGPPS